MSPLLDIVVGYAPLNRGQLNDQSLDSLFDKTTTICETMEVIR